MADYDLSIHQSTDAQRWAKFFVETVAKNPGIATDEATMTGWFANAMMAMHDHLKGVKAINGDHVQFLLDQAHDVAGRA